MPVENNRTTLDQVEAEPEHELDCAEEHKWLIGTTWHWNNWQNVKFESNGKFSAPDKPCEEGRCSWRTTAKVAIGGDVIFTRPVYFICDSPDKTNRV
jgi:hypothetical protein